VTEEDRARWDARYSGTELRPPALPAVFSAEEGLFRGPGEALDVACGTGAVSVWLALRGFEVVGLDISPVALGMARRLAADHAVAERCRFEVADLDGGLPPRPAVDAVVCHLFWDRRLMTPMVERLRPGGVLAIAVLAGDGKFRARPGELRSHPALAGLEVMVEGGSDGRECLVAVR
jgi:SAM-dependent methyltransferase